MNQYQLRKSHQIFPHVLTIVDDDGKKASEKDVVACLVFNVNKYLKKLFYRELKYL